MNRWDWPVIGGWICLLTFSAFFWFAVIRLLEQHA